MRVKLTRLFFGTLPLLLFTALLSGLLWIRITMDFILPMWCAWSIGICWGCMAFGYLLRAELFKQIGEFAVTLLAIIILIGALIPKDQVSCYPEIASEQLVQNLKSIWNSVYTGNLFEQHSIQQQLIDYGTSLGRLDPFRHGKMILFGMLGFMLAICYLFPLEPPRLWHSKQNAKHNAVYTRRFALLFLAGALFAVQMELLQVLSPTRMVTGASIMDSCLGLLIGLIAFLPVHLFYAGLAEHRAKGSLRFNVLGVGVDAVNMDDCIRCFAERIEGRSPVSSAECRAASDPDNQQLTTNNSHQEPVMTSALGVAGLIEARRNPKLQRILNESVLNTPDGMPLVWLGKLFGYRNIERVYGPDLLRDVCAYSASKGWKHFFYGAAPGIVEKLKDRLEQNNRDIQISGIYCPPFRDLTPEEEADVAERVNSSGADIFWIGISTPKQLYFMDHIRPKLNCKIICPVGYGFDVNAGVQDDAPDWAKYSGFQWLHRAIKQPRLWKRYLPDNPRFVAEVLLQILHLRKYPLVVDERPRRSRDRKKIAG